MPVGLQRCPLHERLLTAAHVFEQRSCALYPEGGPLVSEASYEVIVGLKSIQSF